MAILQIKGQTQGSGTVTFTIPTTDEHSTVTLPAKTGTLALTSDIVETDISNLATKSELSTEIQKKADKVHTHNESDVSGLSEKLKTFATTSQLNGKVDKTTKSSETVEGIIMCASDIEVNHGTDVNKAIKPKQIQGLLREYAKNSTVALKAEKSYVDSELAKRSTTEWVTTQLGLKLDSSDAFTQTDADKLYLGKSAKAASATLADKATVLNTARTIAIGGAVTGTATSFNGSSNITINTTTVNGANVTGTVPAATKATQDASGNVITTTYATKTEMNAKAPLANPTFTGTVTISGSGTFKGNLTGTADTAKSASAVAWANVSGKPGLIPTSGNAGTISTSETIANLQTVSATSPRSMKATSGATVTLQQGGAEAWITVVACEGAVTVNLGNGWAWSGSAPTLGKGLITCAWYGSFGIVNFMKWGS